MTACTTQAAFVLTDLQYGSDEGHVGRYCTEHLSPAIGLEQKLDAGAITFQVHVLHERTGFSCDWGAETVSDEIWAIDQDGIKIISLENGDPVAVLNNADGSLAFTGRVTDVRQGEVRVLPDSIEIAEGWRPAQLVRRVH